MNYRFVKEKKNKNKTFEEHVTLERRHGATRTRKRKKLSQVMTQTYARPTTTTARLPVGGGVCVRVNSVAE